MSLRTDLARLDATYRARLARSQAATSLGVSRLFGRLSVNDIIGGTSAVDDWLEQSIRISMAMRMKVSSDTATYLNELSALTFPSAPPLRSVTPEPPTLEQIRTSLWVTGVVSARKRLDPGGDVASTFTPLAAPGTPPLISSARLSIPEPPSLLEQSFMRRATSPDTPEPAQQRALSILDAGRRVSLQQEIEKSGEMAGAAAARHAANAGRDQVVEVAKTDRRVIGYVRVTSGQPCFFCAALASRGPVYDDDSFDESDARFTGPGQHKVHDHCSCSIRPVTSRSHDEWPELSQRFEDQWKALSAETNLKYGRNPTMLDWRRSFVG